MSVANLVYMPKIHFKRWARNGMVPDAKFAAGLVRHLNHTIAYRRKTVWTFGDWDTTAPSGTPHRFRFHSGVAATKLLFRLGLTAATEFPTDPYVTISVTVAGGATTTEEVHIGLGNFGTLTPDRVFWCNPGIAISENTTYEVSLAMSDGARVVSGCAFERASNITSSNSSFVEEPPNAFYPIYDQLRQNLLESYSSVWKRNGSHLMTWSMNATTAPTFTSTTWTNVIDGSTSVSGATPGYYLDDGSGRDLTQHCRVKDGTTIDVVFAAYANCTGGSTGEVRLQNSSGTNVSLTGITSTAQWHTTTTTIASVELIGKTDLQARVAAGGSTLNLHSVCLYALAS